MTNHVDARYSRPRAWVVGVLTCGFFLMVLGLPVTSVGMCSDPGGCTVPGSNSWSGLVDWPFGSDLFVWSYWLITVALGVAAGVALVRLIRRR